MKLNVLMVGVTTGVVVMLGSPRGSAAADVHQRSVEFTVTVGGTPSKAPGDSTDHLLSFGGPVELPGVGLPAGTYLFRVIAPSVVQVMSADRSRLYDTFFTEPTARADAGARAEMIFERTRKDAPVRIGGWFLDDTMDGVAPIYPHG